MTTPVRDLFGIDTRSLAVFRIALAAAIVADLLIRAADLAALHTGEGVLPRALLDEQVRARAPALVPVLALVPHVLLDGRRDRPCCSRWRERWRCCWPRAGGRGG